MEGGTRFSMGPRPHTMITSSPITYESPKVKRISATWPCWCTRRSPKRSTAAPMNPHASGASTSAGQKPTHRPTWYERYAPSMKKLAWAKLSTPIRLKMSVSPLDSMNSKSPYTTPFRSENVAISATELARALHLAGRGERRVLRVDLAVGHEAEAGAFDAVLHLVREGRHEERLQELVIVGAHLHGPQRRVELHALERARELHRVVRLRLVRRGDEHREGVLQAPVVELVGLVGVALVEGDLIRIQRRQDVVVVFGHLL